MTSNSSRGQAELRPFAPLEVLANLLAQTREKKPTESAETSSAGMKRTGSHIVDITDQYVGKSLIISEAAPPKKQLSASGREDAAEKPPKK